MILFCFISSFFIPPHGIPPVAPAFITTCPYLKQPINFNRADPDEFSPVELAVLRGLELERLDFQITAPRERLVPERIKRQQAMLEEQDARLAKA